jgi:hypothetical protein
MPGNRSNWQQNRVFVLLDNSPRSFSSQLEFHYMRYIHGHRLRAASKRESELKGSKKRENLENRLENALFCPLCKLFCPRSTRCFTSILARMCYMTDSLSFEQAIGGSGGVLGRFGVFVTL